MKKLIKNKNGFTLVELLVVITIIGIVSSLAVPSLVRAIDKAKVAEFATDFEAIRGASAQFIVENNGKFQYSSGEKLNDYLDTELLSYKLSEDGELIKKQSTPFGKETFYILSQDKAEASNLKVEAALIARNCKISYSQAEMISNIIGIENLYFVGYKGWQKQNGIFESIKKYGSKIEAQKKSLEFVQSGNCDKFDIVIELIK